MRKGWLIVAVAGLIGLPGGALAYVYGDTNFDFAGYPDPTCHKPVKPYRPLPGAGRFAIQSYNFEVDRYNLDLEAYNRCIRQYVEAAQNDMERIKEKALGAIAEAKSL